MFGELRSQPSRLAPDAAMDPAVGQLVASGLASASTMLAASLLRSAFRWDSSHCCTSYSWSPLPLHVAISCLSSAMPMMAA